VAGPEDSVVKAACHMSAESAMDDQTPAVPPIPSLAELGVDLLRVTPFQRLTSVTLPFL